ncbi:HIT family protein [Weissella diestrammenae]|uniref:HIT family protein n=1 Tax=Weissella diestrammenae TaxID=1162633 RepID=A0A7G9T4V6_9LACO|nr:HIT family protein [Weissella diestrammenae]MCM0582846.1 HIT family protein [Weissella diestrammenae]QNN75131.1 HIT family protein [Weissella diestrammenae]
MADIFDKILIGDIPAFKIYEDQDVLAFLDISQITPGHTLVIPKADLTDIFDYNEADAAKVLSKLPRVARAIKASNPEIVGLNIVSNNGSGAGQIVMHSHFHLIPRYRNDGFKITEFNHADQYSTEQYEALAQKIRQHLEANTNE